MLAGQKASDSDFATAEQTGGAKTKNIAHTHSTPAHNHDYTEPTAGALRDGVKYSSGVLWTNPDIGILQSNNNGSGTSGSGGSTTQDVLNPYFVVYIWKRTA